MNKSLKDQIIELYEQGLDEAAIIFQVDATLGHIRKTINGFKRNKEYVEKNIRNQAVADDFLSVPIGNKFSNFILYSQNPKVWEAYERMINSQNTDKLW